MNEVQGLSGKGAEVNRVFPTGKCWCGCGEATERTSFFVAGHDKRAEAKVVKEVYGGVVEFVAAHGFGPEGHDPAATVPEGTDATGVERLQAWIKGESGAHYVLEVLDPKDRHRVRHGGFIGEYEADDRAFRFVGCSSHSKMPGANLTVPLPDVAWVYTDQNRKVLGKAARVIRLRGAIVVAEGRAPRFVAFG